MTQQVATHPTRCATCGTFDNSDEIYPANFSASDFSPEVFSARRMPDRIHYRLVRCRECGLVRSDPVVDLEVLHDLYKASTFTYEDEVAPLRQTYGRYLDRASHGLEIRNTLLEVGCGNGFFLEEAKNRGWKQALGVEPSTDAIEHADPTVRRSIVCDIMRPGLFPRESIDMICLFQVFDHLPDPAAVLEACADALKPGGRILCLNHNVDAVSARLLGERSPIVDVEHTYLYSPQTLSALFESRGFRVRETGRVLNTYPLRYIFRLLPLPAALKRIVLGVLRVTGLGRVSGRFPLGNLYLVAEKPR